MLTNSRELSSFPPLPAVLEHDLVTHDHLLWSLVAEQVGECLWASKIEAKAAWWRRLVSWVDATFGKIRFPGVPAVWHGHDIVGSLRPGLVDT